MKRKVQSYLIIFSMIICMLPLQTKSAQAESVVSRDDGIWLFPLPYEKYQSFSDWAGCNADYGTIYACPFHGWSCPNNPTCAAAHHMGSLGHQGIDIGTGINTDVYAASRGKIVYYGYDGSRGNWMIMEHPISATGSSYYSIYQHLSSNVLSVSQNWIEPKTVIAKSGNTGYGSGPHLHFEILRGASGRITSSNTAYVGELEGYGWVLQNDPDNSYGRIVTNPKNGGTNLSSVNSHCGSVDYTANPSQVTDWTKDAISGNYYTVRDTTIRETPYEVGNAVASVPKDAHVIVDGKIKNSYNNEWYHVVYGKSSGYIYAPLLTWSSNDINQYYVDVNGLLDGESNGKLTGYGTCDVYINNALVSNDKDDYYTPWPAGTTFSVKDIKTVSGKEFIKATVSGASNGQYISGTKTVVGVVSSGDANKKVRIVLEYKTKASQWSTISTGNYYIRNVATKKYLDASGAGDYNNCDVINWTFNGSNAQLWEISGNASSYKVKPKCTASRVLNQYGNNVASGHNVCLWDNTNDPSQRWVFEKTSDGKYIIRCAGNTNCVLDVNDSGSVYVATYTGRDSQKWELTKEYTLSGDYLIKNKSNSKYMNVNGSGDYNNCDVNTAAKSNTNAQKWNISGALCFMKVAPRCSSTRVLNQYGDAVVSGHNVCLWSNTNDASQRWAFEKVGSSYVIHCAGNESCVLDISSNGSVYVNTYVPGRNSQLWTLEKQ